jgi:protease YdgD
LLLLAALPAAADPAPWSAVGVLGAGCSGVLIEPDLVLTAGHCVMGATGEIPSDFVFQPSTAYGRPGAPFPGHRVTLHPTWLDFVNADASLKEIVARDIALFRLNRPIDAKIARPIPVGPFPTDGGPLTLVSFRRGEPLLRVHECPLRRSDGAVFTVDCEVQSGESGAPVFAWLDDGPVTVGIVSRQSRRGNTDVALGAELGETYRVLREAEAP